VNEQGIVEGWNLSNDGVRGRRSAHEGPAETESEEEDLIDEVEEVED
jgi:hypothetical protein